MKSVNSPVIVWFRQDLRLRDNPALRAAHESGLPIIPIYILDDVNSGDWKLGAASRWWLHQSLLTLNENLQGNLVFEKGDPQTILTELAEEVGASKLYWNRCYEPWRIQRDTEIKRYFKDKRKQENQGIEVKSFNGACLFEPLDVLKKDGTPYRVFTPFYNKGCLGRAVAPRTPSHSPIEPQLQTCQRLRLSQLNLMPAIKWFLGMQEQWQPGEEGAQKRLAEFLKFGLSGYKEGRDFPGREKVSRLSPHLHFGEVSPNEVWHAAKAEMAMAGKENDGEHFLRELAWREFSHTLLYHFPNLPKSNLQTKFNQFSWRKDDVGLRAWQQGSTGYPIVDAGMRELWQTGYMHNRVRMIVGSFLVKNLLIHWHDGERWFWDTLVDADLANNAASWQWIAGSGADAAPYFRIFNPVTQGQKFDKKGEYVRRYVPEIAALPDKYLHNPWMAPNEVLRAAELNIGIDYPAPIVDLKLSRERALATFKQLST